jgi:hypothetical protein
MTERELRRHGFDLVKLAAFPQTDGGIAEEHHLRPTKVERVLDLQLELVQHPDRRVVLSYPLDQAKAESVVTPRRIADAEYEDA